MNVMYYEAFENDDSYNEETGEYDTIVNEVIKPGYGKWADFAMVNAVDIDWNGAQLKNGSTVKATLNTTGEMLSILQTA